MQHQKLIRHMQIPLICHEEEEEEAFNCQLVCWSMDGIVREYLHRNDFESFVVVQWNSIT